MEFAFEDAIDQPLEEEAVKKEEGGVEATGDETAEKTGEEPFNFDQIIEKFENPKNVKKSFEIRYQNDDDDDIFIVHDGEEEGEAKPNEDDQDDLFLDNQNLNFNIIDEAPKDD